MPAEMLLMLYTLSRGESGDLPFKGKGNSGIDLILSS